MDPPVSMGMRTVEAARLRPAATRREGNGAAAWRWSVTGKKGRRVWVWE
jgi:hypothetical protein